MSPTLFADNPRHVALVYPVSTCDRALAQSFHRNQSNNIQDLFRLQFRLTVSFAERWLEAILGFRIVHIVLMRAKEQVIRVTAWPVVARVKNHKTVRNWPPVNQPSKAVGKVVNSVELKTCVTGFWVNETFPRKALALLPRLAPEPSDRIVPTHSEPDFRRANILLNAALVFFGAAAFVGGI